eukprot:4606905-Pyramimonas_sp.AAC.1
MLEKGSDTLASRLSSVGRQNCGVSPFSLALGGPPRAPAGAGRRRLGTKARSWWEAPWVQDPLPSGPTCPHAA